MKQFRGLQKKESVFVQCLSPGSLLSLAKSRLYDPGSKSSKVIQVFQGDLPILRSFDGLEKL